MSGTAFGGDVTRVSTTQEMPLGFKVTVPDSNNGNKVYTYVYNDSGSGIAIDLLAQKKDSSATYAVAVAATGAWPGQIVGMVFQTGGIPNGSYYPCGSFREWYTPSILGLCWLITNLERRP